MSKVIGIDLGTSNSVVAVMQDGEPVVIPNAEGENLTPSIVSFTGDGSYVVGESAKRRAITYPEATVFSIKRLMGRRYREPAVQQDLRFLPYKVIEHRDGDAMVEVGKRRYSPAEISAMILQKLKVDVETYLRATVTQAVITVPAHFNDRQVQATRDAGKIAGLEVLRIINEPTAASLAYGLDRKADERVLVFSFGGGSLDVSILEMGESVFDVKSTTGDTHLGGDDLDMCIIDWLIATFRAEHRVDLARSSAALQRLKDAAERAKIELSSASTADIHLPYIAGDGRGAKHFHLTLTRSKLEELVAPVLKRVAAPIKQAMQDAAVRMDHIDDVVLVGGQTRMPAIQAHLKSLFGKELHRNINPDEVVALGAGIQAGVLTGEVRDVLLLDVIPHSLGVEIVAGSAPEKHTSDSSYDALPAADGKSAKGEVAKQIERNTTIPTQRSEVFTTAKDKQTSVLVHVLQGESTAVQENFSLGRFVLDRIPPARRGVPRIEVTFDIDANGIVSVKAKDKGTGREASITVRPPSSFQREEIERLAHEAAQMAQAERQRRQEAELRNVAAQEADAAEKLQRELHQRAPERNRQDIERAIGQVRAALGAIDLQALNTARDGLQAAIYALTAELYRPTHTGRAGTGGIARDPKTLRIFVSHSHRDNEYCRTFVQHIRESGADIWYDEDDLQYGELTPRIESQLIERPIFIPILTPASLQSHWVAKEAQRFEQLYRLDTSRLILPILGKAIAGELAIWTFLREFKRIEGPQLQPVSPEQAAELALQALT